MIASLFNAASLILRDIRQHKLLTLRAIVIGNVTLLLVWIIFAQRLANLDDWLFVTGLADIRHFWRGGRLGFSHFLIGGGLNLAVGWIVGRSHRRYRTAMVSAFLISLLLILDLPRVLPSLIEAFRRGGEAFSHFAIIGLMDFIFLRLPILIGGVCCVGGVNRALPIDYTLKRADRGKNAAHLTASR